MARQARKSLPRNSGFASEHPHTKDEKVIELKIPANENANENAFLEKTERELEREFGKGKPLEVHMKDIKALRAFRNAFSSIKHADPESLNIYVIHPERNVAITRAFGLTNPEQISFLTETQGEAQLLNQKGYPTKKGIAEGHRTPARVNIMVVMDTHVRPTPRLLLNVAPGGWVLWPAAKANALRANGKYKCMGILEGGAVKDVGEGFWKNAEVENDEELQQASTLKDADVVTYEEAAEGVWEAFGTKHNIVEQYKRLIEMAEQQNKSAVANGMTTLKCSITRDGATIEVRVKTVLPLKQKKIPEESLAIFKKHGFV